MSNKLSSGREVPSTMQCVVVSEAGGPEVLQPSEAKTPTVSANEVLIGVAAAGVNRPDCLQRQGLYPLPPDASPLPGLEVAGRIVSIGSDVRRWEVGDYVVALTHGGGYAQYCVADAGHCLPWPTGWDRFQAAGLPETTFTVQSNLFVRAGLSPGDSVLIHGGSSGIGSTAIQLANRAGASVFATAGSAEKCEFCLKLGANHVYNYKQDDWEVEILRQTDGHGVNVVLDMVAGPYVEKNINVLALDGRYSMIAFLLGPKVEMNFAPVLTKRLTLTASTLRPQSIAQKTAIRDSVEAAVWPLIDADRFQVPIFKTFPLAEASAAHLMMESSGHMGKIILDVNSQYCVAEQGN